MIEIKPEDLIITTYTAHGQGGMHIAKPETGVRLYHKPSGLDISLDKHRSQYKNKNECVIILEDLLTEFKVGDIVVTEFGVAEVSDTLNENKKICYKTYDDMYIEDYLKSVAHTEEGYRYKNEKLLIKEIEDLQDYYNSKVKVLQDKLKKVRED